MRRKRRYLVVEVIGPARLGRQDFLNRILWAHMDYVGEKGFHNSSPRLISFDEEMKVGIVRTYLEGIEDLRASLTLITDIDGEPTIFRTLGVSGTIRAAEDKFIRKSGTVMSEKAKKRNGEEDPEFIKQMARFKAIAPGSVVRVARKEFRLKQVYDDGRVDLTDDEGSYGFTILDLLGSKLGNEGKI
jgi:ribonuclease P/MRP protein subunit POP5